MVNFLEDFLKEFMKKKFERIRVRLYNLVPKIIFGAISRKLCRKFWMRLFIFWRNSVSVCIPGWTSIKKSLEDFLNYSLVKFPKKYHEYFLRNYTGQFLKISMNGFLCSEKFLGKSLKDFRKTSWKDAWSNPCKIF